MGRPAARCSRAMACGPSAATRRTSWSSQQRGRGASRAPRCCTPGERVVELGPGPRHADGGAAARGRERARRSSAIRTCCACCKRSSAHASSSCAASDAAQRRLRRARGASSARALCVAGNLPYAVTGAILRNLMQQRARARARGRDGAARGARSLDGRAGHRRVRRADGVHAARAFEIETRVAACRRARSIRRPRCTARWCSSCPRATPLAEETAAFQRVVRASFQGRRKTLRNAIWRRVRRARPPSARWRGPGIDAVRRGETLSVAEFAALAAAARTRERRLSAASREPQRGTAGRAPRGRRSSHWRGRRSRRAAGTASRRAARARGASPTRPRRCSR